MQDKPDPILRHFPTVLARWKGSTARLWKLTTSHPSLTIRIEHSGYQGNLEVACLGPVYIQGPTEWANCSLRVCRHPKGFEIADDDAGVNIIAEGVEIAENRKPLNVFTTVRETS